VSASSNQGLKASLSRAGLALAMVFALTVVATFALGASSASPVQAAESVAYSDQELQFVRLLNDYRASKGLQRLLISDTISLASDRHSSDMGKYRFFDHLTGYDRGVRLSGTRSDWFPTGSSPFYRMARCGYDYNTSMGEIIAAGYATAEAVFSGWKGSSGHNTVMLEASYRVLGVSLQYVSGAPYQGLYWTVDFGGYVDASAHSDGLYQQTDPRLTYLGNWTATSTSSAWGGSLYSTDSTGAAALVKFTGTSVALVAKTAPWYGEALVSLDGGPEEEVDFYSAALAYRQTVYVKEGLDEAEEHSLTITRAGEKNASASGYSISLDALDIDGSLIQADQPIRHQQEDLDFTYSGSWNTSWTWSASGGSFSYANSLGAAVNVKFEGDYLAWVAKTGYNYGKARVSLDGGPLLEVDLYSASSQYKRCVYNTGKLEAGVHTLSIYWSGLKNARSSGYIIDVDTFDMLGESMEAPAAEPVPTLYQQNDSRLTYLGTWSGSYQTPASDGSFNYTLSQGAAVNASFTGTSVALVAKTANNYGKARVSLDGAAPEYVDFYSPTALYQQGVYLKEDLENGAHTLTIEWTREKNLLSAGYLVNVDALEIMGTLTDAAKPARYQQDNTNFSYAGAWSTSWTWSASGGSFKYTNSPDASVTVRFEGTYLAWVAKTAPWYGKAAVSLDGGDPMYADLYSASTLYKRGVYNTGKLDDGPHTLTISWSGQKNAASSGYQIDVDTFDLLGVPTGIE
jgi:uncharacterized protein YkwD